MIVPVAFFAMIAAIVLGLRYFKNKEREQLQLQDTIRVALERGQTLPPEVLAAITPETMPRSRTSADLRKGIIWIAVAAGVAVLAFAAGYDDEDAFNWMLALAAFPGLIGAAYLILAAIMRPRGSSVAATRS